MFFSYNMYIFVKYKIFLFRMEIPLTEDYNNCMIGLGLDDSVYDRQLTQRITAADRVR